MINYTSRVRLRSGHKLDYPSTVENSRTKPVASAAGFVVCEYPMPPSSGRRRLVYRRHRLVYLPHHGGGARVHLQGAGERTIGEIEAMVRAKEKRIRRAEKLAKIAQRA
jgi:hypothetical protein